ncbi:hypothetical protein N9L92_00410 [Saprospiraceae bacterium]|nr:hypothetical protein [Saprospiraceae bacterium]
MNPQEYTIAQMEIAQGVTWELSTIEPKTETKKADWDRLVHAYNIDMGWMQ